MKRSAVKTKKIIQKDSSPLVSALNGAVRYASWVGNLILCDVSRMALLSHISYFANMMA